MKIEAVSKVIRVRSSIEGKQRGRAEFPLLILLLYLAASSNQPLHYILGIIRSSPITPLAGFQNLFKKLDLMIDKWNYKQEYALSVAAKLFKDRKVSAFLLRLSQALSVGTYFKDFMKIEHTKFIITSQREHLNLIDRLRWMGEAYSALITAGTVISVSMISVSTLLGTASATQSLQLTLIGVPAAAAALTFLIAKVSPRYEVVTDLECRPPRLTYLLKLGKILYVTLLVLTPICFYILHQLGLSFYGWSLMALSGAALFTLGKFGLREVKQIRNFESQFILFIKVLGEAVAAAGTLTQGIRLIAQSEFGKMTNHIKKLLSRLTLGFDSNVCWLNFAAETGSRLISDFTQILLASTKIGGKMNEVCLTIADWVNEELVRRARREQAANYLKGLVFPIQGTLVAILTMTTVLIEILNRFASIPSAAPIRFVSPVDLHLLVFFNFTLLFALAVISSAAIYFTDGSTLFNLYYNLGLFLLVSGLGVAICQTFAVNVLSLFAGFESKVGAVIP
ncbi:MAG: hypothetical protein HA494_05815 [Thaumarchaeota archaeon]|nr:hypothetical protein [Nitrososphaerota archaeon]